MLLPTPRISRVLFVVILVSTLPTSRLWGSSDDYSKKLDEFFRAEAAEREMRVWTITDEFLLYEIARKDGDWKVRLAAVENPSFTSQSWLALIASMDEDIAEAAIDRMDDLHELVGLVYRHGRASDLAFEKLRSKQALEDIVKNQDHPYPYDDGVRAKSVFWLADSRLLAVIAESDRDTEVRAAALSNPNMKDEQLLIRVATDPKSERNLVLAAAKNLNLKNQAVLAGLLKNPDPSIRRGAIINPNFNDQDLLLSIVNQTNRTTDGASRNDAASHPNFKNRAVLTDLAKQQDDWGLRWAAIRNPNLDQAVLAFLAKDEPDDSIRSFAVEKLTDSTLLGEIAMEDRSGRVRMAAVNNEQLVDVTILAKLAMGFGISNTVGDKDTFGGRLVVSNSPSDIRVAALERLRDPVILGEIALKEQDCKIRVKAIENTYFDDTVLLAQIASLDKCSAARRNAVRKVNDANRLLKICDNGRYPDARHMAVWKLTDPAVLQEIAKHSKERWLREVAQKKLAQLPKQTGNLAEDLRKHPESSSHAAGLISPIRARPYSLSRGNLLES